MSKRNLIDSLVVLMLIILIAACTVGAASNVPQATQPSGGVELSSADVMRVTEALRVLAAHGNIVWPGWHPATPLLLRQGQHDYLIGHPAPPADFEPIPNVSINGLAVLRRPDHLVPVPAATTWQVAGQWSVAVPTRDEFQQAIDETLGKGAVDLNDAAYVRTIVHEAFHAHQLTLMNGNVPDFGSRIDERQAMQFLASITDLDQRLAVEGQALRAGIEAASMENVRQAAATFLLARRERRAKYPEVAAYEQSLEWAEGLARYADVRLMQRAGAEATGTTSVITYPDDTWREFLDQLSNLASIPTGPRDRYALLGAGQAFLLDRFAQRADWKPSALPGGAALESLVSRAILSSD